MRAIRRERRTYPHPSSWWRRSGGQGTMALTVILAVLALVAASCGKSTSPTASSSPTIFSTVQPPSGSQTTGGTVTWAEGPSATPNYIFPIASSSYFSVTNLSQLQALLYRPLYWFGNNYTASVDYDYSIGQAPVWSNDNKTVTITLNAYKWSNGETVTGRDVLFFYNLLKANTSSYGAYVPGYFPDNVASASASGQTVTFTLKQAYNPTWFLYNQLSEITPLPLAWDVTGAGQAAPTGNAANAPDTTTAGAKAVFTYLDGLSKNTATYANSPVWSIVDGPWTLSNFTNTGEADFVPNPNYSGPQFGAPKATLAKFEELPYTSEPAEMNVAKTGPNNLTIGWIPSAQVPQTASVVAKGYNAYKFFTYSINYFELNMHNPKLGPVFSQTYFRQAFQELVNQPGWDTAFQHGTAVPTYGVVPTVIPNPFADTTETARPFPFPFSVSKASQTLSSHGWKVSTDGRTPTTCQSPGTGPTQCGANIPAGTALEFNLDYQAGPVSLDQEMKDLKSEAAKAGVILDLTTHPFDNVISTATQCAAGDAKCNWTAENWGGGWVYSPDFYPSGEELFATGAVSNQNNYSDPTADALIQATTTAPTSTAQTLLNEYQDYMQQQLPVVFQPNVAGNPVPGGLTIVSKKLGGFSVNAFSYITPETYYLTQ
jgi:peptide/nickel transport system substrate-binding protein